MAFSPAAEHYHGLVDMGSNGIRFSITDLSPSTARILPTIYQDRSDISLYDAQYLEGGKGPIPQHVIDKVLSALLRFKRTCEDFGLNNDQVRIVATEATREAVNSQDYRRQIETQIGWKVEMLAKEEEGRIGAMGIASGFSTIRGLALDLGGGSTQISWLVAKNGEVETSPKGSVSFPYGAAALMRLLDGAPGVHERDELQKQLAGGFKKAIEDLDMPSTFVKDAENEGGFTLYLSGGGFRGWGYILMSVHAIQPYPIPMINGFRVPIASFLPELSESTTDDSTFRISSRRASQVPAVIFLIQALTQSLPSISCVYFAQGGLREGLLFSTLSASVRSQDPLATATLKYAPVSTAILVKLLGASLPPYSDQNQANPPPTFYAHSFQTAVIHLLTAHAHLPKDICAATALRSTTTGLLASAHGISHDHRALLALVLCERWGHKLSPSDTEFHAKLQQLAGPEASWWAKFFGRVARGIGNLFPAGLVRHGDEHRIVHLQAQWRPSSKSKPLKKAGRGATDAVLSIELVDYREVIDELVRDWAEALEKVGKKKHWVGSRAEDDEDGFGCRVEVQIEKRAA
ncbi:hypothetical protein MMC07_004912 [Pseudocyphellaria aurata]|nr:hypothetical protein [Pseudocyphellaria aurata]